MLHKTLSGDHNQCPTCNEYFNSTYAFEKHRVGEIGVDRRCLSTYEMTAKGFVVNHDGFWVTKARTETPVPASPVMLEAV